MSCTLDDIYFVGVACRYRSDEIPKDSYSAVHS